MIGVLALLLQASVVTHGSQTYIVVKERESPESVIVDTARCGQNVANLTYRYGEHVVITALEWNGHPVSQERLAEVNRVGEVSRARVIYFNDCWVKAQDGFDGMTLNINKLGRGVYSGEPLPTRYFFLHDGGITERAPVARPIDRSSTRSK